MRTGRAVPFIEVAKKIARFFEATLNYLGGESINAPFDKRTVKQMQWIEGLSDYDKYQLVTL